MVELEKPPFDAEAFLSRAGLGRRIVQIKPKESFFTQGEPADSVFYLQRGRAKFSQPENLPGVKLKAEEGILVVLSDAAGVGAAGPLQRKRFRFTGHE